VILIAIIWRRHAARWARSRRHTEAGEDDPDDNEVKQEECGTSQDVHDVHNL
jgi:hypothetical protein